MKLFLLAFILGLLVAVIGAKALGEGGNSSGAVGVEDPRLHHHRRAAQGPTDNKPTTGNANEEAIDLLRRLTRQAALGNKDTPSGGNKAACKYRKGSWSACDATTKVRTRTLTLKKGDVNVCESTKTLQKQCKGGKKGGKQRNNNGKNRPNKNRNNNGENSNRPAGGNRSKTQAV